MFDLSPNVASIHFRCSKNFGFPATDLLRGGGGEGKGGSISDGSGIWMGVGVLNGEKAGATGIGDRGGLWASTVGVTDFSEQELYFSDLLDVCSVDPLSINFEFVSETDGAESRFFLSDVSGDESRITLVSGKKLIVTVFFGSVHHTLSSVPNESEVSIVKYFKLVSVLLYYSGDCFESSRFSFLRISFKKVDFLSKRNSRVLMAKCKRYNLWCTRKRLLWMFSLVFHEQLDSCWFNLDEQFFFQINFCEKEFLSGGKEDGMKWQYFFLGSGRRSYLVRVFLLEACICLKCKKEYNWLVN